MAKTKPQKQQMLKSYQDRLGDVDGVLVISQTGLQPRTVTEFKMKLSEVGSTYGVVKNTLFKIALKDAELPELEAFEAGPNAVIFVSEDIAGTAKIVKDFVKDNKEKVTVRGGILEGQELTAEQIDSLAEMPTKEQSVAMIAGLLEQSVAGMAYVLEDSVRSIAIILDKAFTEETA